MLALVTLQALFIHFLTNCFFSLQGSNDDGIQLSSVVSYLMDLIPFMSPMSVHKIFKNMITVVKESNDISPVVSLQIKKSFRIPYPNCGWSD